MNIQKLNDCMEMLRKDAGEALIFSRIVSMVNGNALVTAGSPGSGDAKMFRDLKTFIQKTQSRNEPPFGRYYYIDLAQDKGFLFIPHGSYQWAIYIDTKKIKLGLLLSMYLPQIMKSFQEAVRA